MILCLRAAVFGLAPSVVPFLQQSCFATSSMAALGLAQSRNTARNAFAGMLAARVLALTADEVLPVHMGEAARSDGRDQQQQAQATVEPVVPQLLSQLVPGQ